MKKQIIIETPYECPYLTDWKDVNTGEIIRQWCTFRGYDECNGGEIFPRGCPLDDVHKQLDLNYYADYIISRYGGNFVGNNKGYVIQEMDVVEEFKTDLMYEISTELIPEIYRLIRRKQIKSGVRKMEEE